MLAELNVLAQPKGKKMDYPIYVAPGHTLDIFHVHRTKPFAVEPDPLDPSQPYFEFGGTGSVLKLREKSSNQPFALKIFNPPFQTDNQISYANNLKSLNLHQMDGLSVADRTVIHPATHEQLLKEYDALNYALLMPWIPGLTWQEVLIGNKTLQDGAGPNLSKEECFMIAFKLCQILAELEERQCAHCDLCSNNIIINPDTSGVELIDIEDMYGPGFVPTEGFQGGQKGYAHPRNVLGHQWRSESDRYGGAILIAEIMAWHSSLVREQSGEESYFLSDKELRKPDSEPLSILINALEEQTSPRVTALFQQAWHSASLAECPPLAEWKAAIFDAKIHLFPDGIFPLELPSIAINASPIVGRRGKPSPQVTDRRRQIQQSESAVPITHRRRPIQLDEPAASVDQTPTPIDSVPRNGTTPAGRTFPNGHSNRSTSLPPKESQPADSGLYTLTPDQDQKPKSGRAILLLVIVFVIGVLLWLLYPYRERLLSQVPNVPILGLETPIVRFPPPTVRVAMPPPTARGDTPSPTVQVGMPSPTVLRGTPSPTPLSTCPAGMEPVSEGETAFCLDKYEVSRQQYDACIDAGICEFNSEDDTNVPDWPGYSTMFPVVNVSWEQARAFCQAYRLQGEDKPGRLPTLEEWQIAYARHISASVESLVFPVAITDTTSLGESEDRITGLESNVREWVVAQIGVNDNIEEVPALAGYSYLTQDAAASIPLTETLTTSEQDRTQEIDNDRGFRCAADLPQ